MISVIHGLSVSTLDPARPEWVHWIDAPRLDRAAQFRLREDRARCMGAGLLLAYAVRSRFPEHPLPLRVETDSLGKPFLPDLPDFHFNLSHSGKWVVCAVATHPVGVDIEHISSPMQDIAQRFFSPDECAHLHALPEADRPAAFCELWVLKESYMKATGLGFHLPLEQLSIRFGPPAVLLRDGAPVPGRVALCPFPDSAYRLALAAPQSNPIAEHLETITLDAILRHLSAT